MVCLDKLRCFKIAVWLLFIHIGKNTHKELARVRDAGLRADAHQVISRRHVRRNSNGHLHLAIFRLFHALLSKAGGKEDQALKIRQLSARERQLDLRATLAAVRLRAVKGGISRKQARAKGKRRRSEKRRTQNVHGVMRGRQTYAANLTEITPGRKDFPPLMFAPVKRGIPEAKQLDHSARR